MGTSRKHVQSTLKVGDYVKVINPRQIVRVGYPKGLNDYVKEICQDPEYGELVRRLNQFGECNSWPVLEDRRGTTVTQRKLAGIIRELAYLRGQSKGWGGNQRTVHYQDNPAILGQRMRIEEISYKRTGFREAGYGTYEDYVPPNFYTDGTVKILRGVEPSSLYIGLRPLQYVDLDAKDVESWVDEVGAVASSSEIE